MEPGDQDGLGFHHHLLLLLLLDLAVAVPSFGLGCLETAAAFVVVVAAVVELVVAEVVVVGMPYDLDSARAAVGQASAAGLGFVGPPIPA